MADFFERCQRVGGCPLPGMEGCSRKLQLVMRWGCTAQPPAVALVR